MGPKAKWAIDSEVMRARGIIIVLVKTKYRDKTTLATVKDKSSWEGCTT